MSECEILSSYKLLPLEGSSRFKLPIFPQSNATTSSKIEEVDYTSKFGFWYYTHNLILVVAGKCSITKSSQVASIWDYYRECSENLYLFTCLKSFVIMWLARKSGKKSLNVDAFFASYECCSIWSLCLSSFLFNLNMKFNGNMMQYLSWYVHGHSWHFYKFTLVKNW